MALLTRQNFALGGLAASYAAAAAGGDTVDNDGKVVLHVKNGGAGAINVTVAAQVASLSVEGYGTLTRSDVVVSVPAGGERFIGPFPPRAFNDANGRAAITYDAVTSVTLAALQM
jgi:hypothetical protein